LVKACQKNSHFYKNIGKKTGGPFSIGAIGIVKKRENKGYALTTAEKTQVHYPERHPGEEGKDAKDSGRWGCRFTKGVVKSLSNPWESHRTRRGSKRLPRAERKKNWKKRWAAENSEGGPTRVGLKGPKRKKTRPKNQ